MNLQKNVEISIFMPVFNGSKYLNKTVNSIMSQTFTDFELVCLDDSSTDNSFEILKHFQSVDNRIKLYQKPNGGNVPKSWNYILPELKGNSIMYISQDDLISKDHLEKLYLRQKETNADCILPDMEWYHEDKDSNIRIVGVDGDRNIVLTNREALLLSLNWRIHGFGLWKSDILKNEYFPEDSFNGDEFMSRKLFFKSNKIAFCDSVFYYRQDNNNSITKTFGKKNYFSILTEYKIYNLLKENKFEEELIHSSLYILYRFYLKYSIFCLKKKGLYSKSDQQEVKNMLVSFYSLLQQEKFPVIEKKLKLSEIYRIYAFKIVSFLFANYNKYIH